MSLRHHLAQERPSQSVNKLKHHEQSPTVHRKSLPIIENLLGGKIQDIILDRIEADA